MFLGSAILDLNDASTDAAGCAATYDSTKVARTEGARDGPRPLQVPDNDLAGMRSLRRDLRRARESRAPTTAGHPTKPAPHHESAILCRGFLLRRRGGSPGLLGQLGEGSGVADGEIGKDLAIE